jgi:hypothetical protein
VPNRRREFQNLAARSRQTAMRRSRR